MTRKFILSFFLIASIFPIHTSAVNYPDVPAIPDVSPDRTETVMIIVDKAHAQAFSEKIKENYPGVKIRRTFKKVFSGYSLEGSHNDLIALQKDPHIIHASPVASYRVDLEESVPFIGGDDVRGLFDSEQHRLTGEGVKVGIIDTGIDYTHPDLSRSYAGGTDIIDGDDDPMETKATDGTETLHGTHVAGIIAANGRLKGVAPEAEIIAYRALGPGGFGTSEQVIAAIEKAIEDKVDVLNLSLGNMVNGPDWPTSLALDRAVEHGITAVVSTGNSGPGVWTVGSPGTSSKAISVGASTPPQRIPYLTASGSRKEIPVTQMAGAKEWTLHQGEEMVFAGIGEEHQYSPDMKGKVVLVERGKITFTEKALFAEKIGAKAVVIYNNMKGSFAGNLELPANIPVVSISKEDGLWLKKQLDKKPVIRTVYRNESDQMADFSSRGPVTRTWEIKPDVVAPGVAIDSTVPEGYLSLQGTSMSAPHVAGAAALIKQAHPEWKPEQIKAALMNSSRPLSGKKADYYQPIEQGAGRIDVMKALETEALMYPGTLSFGQVIAKGGGSIQKKVKLTLDNQSDKEVVYSFSYPFYKKGVQWDMPGKVTVPAGGKREIYVKLNIYASKLEKGLHQGWIKAEADETVRELPYLFVVDEPDYPRVMGFEFGFGDSAGVYQYELYLPGGADEMGIALYDPDTLRFVAFLDWGRDLQKGAVKKTFRQKDLGLEDGLYKAVVFARKGDREDTFETDLILENPKTKLGN
ncbi:S8 family serine peptidase [Metabacillus sp. SLBN-84]